MHNNDETYRQSTRPMQLVRMAGPPTAMWEYATLNEKLIAGGTATATILQEENGELASSNWIVSVFDRILPESTELASGSRIKIDFHPKFQKWYLNDWSAART